jgi:hypothetical protein
MLQLVMRVLTGLLLQAKSILSWSESIEIISGASYRQFRVLSVDSVISRERGLLLSLINSLGLSLLSLLLHQDSHALATVAHLHHSLFLLVDEVIQIALHLWVQD